MGLLSSSVGAALAAACQVDDDGHTAHGQHFCPHGHLYVKRNCHDNLPEMLPLAGSGGWSLNLGIWLHCVLSLLLSAGGEHCGPGTLWTRTGSRDIVKPSQFLFLLNREIGSWDPGSHTVSGRWTEPKLVLRLDSQTLSTFLKQTPCFNLKPSFTANSDIPKAENVLECSLVIQSGSLGRLQIQCLVFYIIIITIIIIIITSKV